jgi:predicted XRE-type DNA-binding protein
MAARSRRQRKAPERVIPKETLAQFVADVLEKRGLSQTEAAELMDDAPSQVSLVVGGKVRGFSPERLLRMIAKLGHDVEIVIRKGSSGRQGKVRVVTR